MFTIRLGENMGTNLQLHMIKYLLDIHGCGALVAHQKDDLNMTQKTAIEIDGRI